MKRISIATATLAVAACGGGQSSTDNAAANAAGGATANAAAGAGAAPAARAAGGGLPMQPGAWQLQVRMDMPDAPPEVRAHMNANQTITHRTCMTPEKLADANRAFFAGGSDQGGAHCDTTGLRIANGRVDGAVVCTGPDNQSVRIAMNGTLGATEYEMRQQVQSPQGSMTSHVVARRVGDCTVQEIAEANADRATDAGGQ